MSQRSETCDSQLASEATQVPSSLARKETRNPESLRKFHRRFEINATDIRVVTVSLAWTNFYNERAPLGIETKIPDRSLPICKLAEDATSRTKLRSDSKLLAEQQKYTLCIHLAQKKKEKKKEPKEKRKRKSEEKWNTFSMAMKTVENCRGATTPEPTCRRKRRRARTTNPGIRVAARFQRLPREQLANSPDVAGFEVCG